MGLLHERRDFNGVNEEVLIEACGRKNHSRVQMMRFDTKQKFKKASVSNYKWIPGDNYTAGIT
jgi:hypothetical protein